ncbi:hypothetical protein N0V90_011010 [Kalmusia sp. IMI 367209]|nr:hypothetical protein N0V90_011010 [Kalmusia sp. IMI 367209]
MFRWHSNAAGCYVYLSDVSTGDSIRDNPSFKNAWKPLFRCSKWFTRGWTLQELLAPNSVEFFSAEGEKLGEKKELIQEIHEITGIDIRALQGNPLSQISVEDRMSWAERRQTKREEDAAYSLLGIFNVHLPLIYGERKKKAFIRLRKEIREQSNEEIRASAPAQQKRRHSLDKRGPIEKRYVICDKCMRF